VDILFLFCFILFYLIRGTRRSHLSVPYSNSFLPTSELSLYACFSTRIIHSLFKKRAFLPSPFSCGSEATEMVIGVTQLLSLFITLKVKGKVAIFIRAHAWMCVGNGGTAPPVGVWKCCVGRRTTLDVLEEKKIVIMAALSGFWPPCRLSRDRCTPYAKVFSNSLSAVVLNEN